MQLVINALSYQPVGAHWRRTVPLILLVSSYCAPSSAAEQVLEVVALDYAFQAPDTTAPGRTLVRVRNAGKVVHEMIVFKLRRSALAADLVAAHGRDESFRPFVEGGNAVLFAEPGRTGDTPLVVEFEPGRDYVLWCNFTDAEGTPQHATLGMFKVIHVGNGTPRSAPAAMPNQVVVDAGDYAFSAPDTLPAGLTEFRMRNSGQQRHEVALGRLAPGITAAFFLSEDMKGNSVDSLYDNDGALLTAYPGDDNRTAMQVQLLPGRTYVLVCEFRDAPDKPRHIALGMFKEVVVPNQ